MMRASILASAVGLGLLSQTPRVAALDNGLGRLPPLAWRSWNAFHTSFNQTIVMDMVDQLVSEQIDAGLEVMRTFEQDFRRYTSRTSLP